MKDASFDKITSEDYVQGFKSNCNCLIAGTAEITCSNAKALQYKVHYKDGNIGYSIHLAKAQKMVSLSFIYPRVKEILIEKDVKKVLYSFSIN